MIELAQSFIKWRLGKRSSLLGWATVFVVQALLAAALFSLFLFIFEVPFNAVSGYCGFAFAVAAGLSGLVFASLWAGLATLIANVSAGAFFGAYVGSAEWWIAASAEWSAGKSIPIHIVAILAAIPLIYAALSFGLHRVWTIMLDNFFRKAMARKAQRSVESIALLEGQVTEAEAAIYIQQGDAGSEGLTVTDRSVISQPGADSETGEISAEGDEAPTSTGSALYDGLEVGGNKAALAGLDDGGAAGAAGQKKRDIETKDVKGLVPTRFGGTKSKQELPREMRKRLQMLAESYSTDVDVSADRESAIVQFMQRFEQHLRGMTDEHFAYLESLSQGNGEGVAEAARKLMQATPHLETSYDDAIEATSGIDELSADNLERGRHDPEGAGTGSVNGTGLSSEIDDAARSVRGRRLSSLLMQAASEGAVFDPPEEDAGAEEPAFVKPSSNDGSKGGADEGPSDAGPSEENPLENSNDISDVEAILAAANSEEGKAGQTPSEASEDTSGSDEALAPGRSGETEVLDEGDARDGDALGFEDETSSNAGAEGAAKSEKEMKIVAEETQQGGSAEITEALCYELGGLLRSKGSGGEVRKRLENFEKARAVAVGAVLESAVFNGLFEEDEASRLRSRHSQVLRNTMDQNIDTQKANLARLVEQVQQMENQPHTVNMQRVNVAESQCAQIIRHLKEMDTNDIEVINANGNAENAAERIAVIRYSLANPAPKVQLGRGSLGDLTNFLDQTKRENAIAAGAPMAEGNAAVAVSAIPQPAKEETAPAPASAPSHPLAEFEEECSVFPEFSEIVEAARRGEAWHQHPNLGDVNEDPFVPLEKGPNFQVERRKQFVLMNLRGVAKPLVDADKAKAVEEQASAQALEDRRREAAALAQDKERNDRERADLNEQRSKLSELEASLVARERHILEREKLVDSFDEAEFGLLEAIREEASNFFVKKNVPERFAHSARAYEKLLFLKEMRIRMVNLVTNVGANMAVEGLDDSKQPHAFVKVALDAALLNRNSDVFCDVCRTLGLENPASVNLETLTAQAESEEC